MVERRPLSPLRLRTVFISDIHLGFKGCSADLLLDFLHHVEMDCLFLVGDIIDVWSMQKSMYWPQAHNNVLRTILGKAKRGTKVIFVPGNHELWTNSADSGEKFVHEGRRISVTPPPHTPGGPTLMWGGASLAAARRAGRYGLGLLANGGEPGMQEAYESGASEHGHQPGPVLVPDRETPTVVFVADDVDQAWDEIGQHLLHDARMYADWNPDNETSAGISPANDVAELRETSKSHRILSVAEAVERVSAGEMLNLSPLCGGLPPQMAWPYLKRIGEVVLPEAARARGATASSDGIGDALNELISTKRSEQ